jgi:hypothetical protein
MARATRHQAPGQVSHITHRGHRQEFLLSHATALESGAHLPRCPVYIELNMVDLNMVDLNMVDLNMVRSGVVSHPSAWRHGGCNEIQSPPKRYRRIDREKLIACCELGSDAELVACHRESVEEPSAARAIFASPSGRRLLLSGARGS